MCAINGIFAYHYASNSVRRSELIASRDHMAARGPDGSGEWIEENCRIALGHRRLSIIDLSMSGAQPMMSTDNTLVITFNGEIYNYRELRLGLERKGYLFRSNSDTEVLLNLYADRGHAMVRALRGMFAFAIWDRGRSELFLARDPYGIKPLYYSDDGWTFRFASQVKALLAGGMISAEPEPAGVAGFFLWGTVPEPFTTFSAVRALPAGCTIKVDKVGAHEVERYHCIAEVYQTAERNNLSAASDVSELRKYLLDSVRHHLVSDVPVGAFLSAGIDSGALVGLMRDAGQENIQTVTIAFEEFAGQADDEAPLAEYIARYYGTQHTTRVVTRSEFESDLPHILDAMDQPTIDGINTWFVAKAARELGLKVAISGLGGDELFGGYPSFKDVPSWVRWCGILNWLPGLGRTIRWSAGWLPKQLVVNPKAPGIVELGGSYPGAYLLRRGLFMPWELGEVVDEDIAKRGLRRLAPLKQVAQHLPRTDVSAHAKVSILESALYMRNQLLRDTDWASMAHSVEVRVPLVDSVLLSQIAPIALAWSTNAKRYLGESPSRPLPNFIAERRKTGFSTPVARWMSNLNHENLTSISAKRRQSGPWARNWSLIVAAKNSIG